MRIQLATIAACAALALAGASTGAQAASSMCNIFANPWPSLERQDGSPPDLDLHNPACATKTPTATAHSIMQPKHTGQVIQPKQVGTAASAHS